MGTDTPSKQFNLKKEYLILSAILLLSFGLNIYGIDWGLPFRWNIDQEVTPALNMIKNKTLSPEEIAYHPTLHYYVLNLFIAPYLVYHYLFNPDFSQFISTADVSWNYMSLHFPDLASGIFIAARLSSVIISTLTVFVVYKTGKYLHSSLSGLFAAGILALTMDFVNWAHLTKSISLVNFLTLLSMYYAFRVFQGDEFKKNFRIFCFLGGLSLASKFNGGITLAFIPIVALLPLLRKGLKEVTKDDVLEAFRAMSLGIGIYAAFFFIGSPNMLFSVKKYLMASSVYSEVFLPKNSADVLSIFVPNLIGLSHTLVQMMGVPLFLLVISGMVYSLFEYGRQTPAIVVNIILILSIFLIFSVTPRIYARPGPKFIIQIVPFLSILGGILSADIISGKCMKWVNKKIKVISITIVFIISFYYCFSLDRIYAADDLRYQATRWVLNNIPHESSIGIVEQIETTLGVEVLNNYKVHVLPGTKEKGHSYSFINREYYPIIEERVEKKIYDMDSIYILRSCTYQKHGQMDCHSLDKFKGELNLLKSFSRKDRWFWEPSLAGYEPSKIEIYHKENGNTKIN